MTIVLLIIVMKGITGRARQGGSSEPGREGLASLACRATILDWLRAAEAVHTTCCNERL